jgi:DNA-binding transcriptional MocR family regulator
VYGPAKVSFAAACLEPAFYPAGKLNRILSGTLRENPDHSAAYFFPPGLPELRRQIARRSPELACHFSPQDIVITSGATEGVHLCLQAVAKPGEVIAVESPVFFGILLAISSLGMKVIEVPTDPRAGLDLDVLERLLRRGRVRACIVTSNCQNPLGYVMSDESKDRLAKMAARYEAPVIEDDVFGDLAFGERRPSTVKSFDRAGLVLLCSSYSKTLAPGFRIGWVEGGRFRSTVEQLKFVSSLAAPSLSQRAMAEFLVSGGYDRHLRRLRVILERQVLGYSRVISESFPLGTRVSRPKGGFLLWVELPRNMDAVRLCRHALHDEGIAALPGTFFSAGGRFRNCMRLSCSKAWAPATERALRTLGRLCREIKTK